MYNSGLISVFLFFLLLSLSGLPAEAASEANFCPSCACLRSAGETWLTAIPASENHLQCRIAEPDGNAPKIEPLLASYRKGLRDSCGDEGACEALYRRWSEMVTQAAAAAEANGDCGYSKDAGLAPAVAEIAARCAFDQYITKQYVEAVRAIRGQREDSSGLDCKSHRILCSVMMNLVRLENAMLLERLIAADEILAILERSETARGAAFLLAQHADRLPEIQRQALKVFETAFEKGWMNGQRLAMLEDRVLSKLEGKQKFGSQMRCVGGEAVPSVPLLDPGRVEELRAERRMIPLAEYKARIEKALCKQDERARPVPLTPDRVR